MDTRETAKPDVPDISSSTESSSPNTSASVTQTSTLLSLPRELRNEIYQHFVPTWAPQLEYRSLRLTCHQLKEELDEEILHVIRQYHDTLSAQLSKPETIISHQTLLPNMLPAMAHSTATFPGLSVSITPATTFAESRTLHLELGDTDTSDVTIESVLIQVIPHIRTCIFEHVSAKNRSLDAVEIKMRVFRLLPTLGKHVDRSIKHHAGVSRIKLLFPALDVKGQEQAQGQKWTEIQGCRGTKYRYSQSSYEAFAPFGASELLVEQVEPSPAPRARGYGVAVALGIGSVCALGLWVLAYMV